MKEGKDILKKEYLECLSQEADEISKRIYYSRQFSDLDVAELHKQKKLLDCEIDVTELHKSLFERGISKKKLKKIFFDWKEDP